MTDEPTTEAPEAGEAPAAEASAAEAPQPEGPIKIRIGPVRMYTECTLKLGGCKAMHMGAGNSFPVDHAHKGLQKPFAMACSACLQRMQRDGKWLIP